MVPPLEKLPPVVAAVLLKVIVLPLTVSVSPSPNWLASELSNVVEEIGALVLSSTALPVVEPSSVLDSSVLPLTGPEVLAAALPVTDELVNGVGGVPSTSGLWLKSAGFRPPLAVMVPEVAVALAVVVGTVGRLAAY